MVDCTAFLASGVLLLGSSWLFLSLVASSFLEDLNWSFFVIDDGNDEDTFEWEPHLP